MTDNLRKKTHHFRWIVLGVVLLSGAIVIWTKHAVLQFRLENFLHPIVGEIIFHADRDGDGIPQLYHLTFNTGLRTNTIEQLTTLPGGAAYGRYSPDGSQITFESSGSIFLMNADGSAPRVLTEGHSPLWMDTYIVFQRVIGYYLNEFLNRCELNAPFVYDTALQQVSPLYQLPEPLPDLIRPQPDGILRFDVFGVSRGYSCPYGHFLPQLAFGNYSALGYMPNAPADFHPVYRFLESMGWLDRAFELFRGDATLSPSDQQLARAHVYPYWDTVSGIERFTGDQWNLIHPVDSRTVSWSPDEQYLVYDGRHPDGTWVIALSTVTDSLSYTLIGNDGINYYAPNWRPR